MGVGPGLPGGLWRAGTDGDACRSQREQAGWWKLLHWDTWSGRVPLGMWTRVLQPPHYSNLECQVGSVTPVWL